MPAKDFNLSSKKKSGEIALIVIEKGCSCRHVTVGKIFMARILLAGKVLLTEGNGHFCCCLNPVLFITLFGFLHQLTQRSSKGPKMDLGQPLHHLLDKQLKTFSNICFSFTTTRIKHNSTYHNPCIHCGFTLLSKSHLHFDLLSDCFAL